MSFLEAPHLPDAQASKSAEEAFAWHQSHRIPDAPPGQPLRGFGPQGMHVLWLPSGEMKSRIVIRDGKPRTEVIPSLMTTPEMLKLRHDTIAALGGPDGKIRFDMSLVEYAATLIRTCYQVSDDDLTMLLDGVGWHEEVVLHLIGGSEHAEKLLRLNVEKALAGPEPQIVYIPAPARPKKRWWWPWTT